MAQTVVEVTGLVDTYIDSLKYSGDAGRTSVVDSGGIMTTYWICVKGTEDLGGGLKAKFNLTSLFRSNNGGAGRFDGNETMFSRDANVGLIGNFGAISLGKDLAPNFLPLILFNPFGDSFKLSPLIADKQVHVKQRHTAVRIRERLCGEDIGRWPAPTDPGLCRVAELLPV